MLATLALRVHRAKNTDEIDEVLAHAAQAMGPADLRDLREIANTVLEARTALEREQQASRRTEALEAVGRAIAAQLDLHEIVQLATDAATELTGAQFGAFFYNVTGPRGEALMLYTLSGAPREAFERFGMPRNTDIFAPTFNGDGIVRIADVTMDPRYGRNAPLAGMPEGHLPVCSYLAVPVVLADGEVAGGLFFGHPDAEVFDADDERIAAGIASQAAVALVNARLYETAHRELEKREAAFRERDHVAEVLQESLLPPHLPEIPGMRLAARYRPGSSTVGGDFYDVFPQSGHAWGVVIGDICGRGPEAAARTALTRHSIRTAAMLEDRPSTVLTIANQSLIRHSQDRFATVWYGELKADGDGGIDLRFAAGGHPPAILLRNRGSVETLGTKGPLLGVIDPVAIADREVHLGPGDVLVLYTDGLIEGRCDGEVFGEDRLRAALARCAGQDAEQIADCLLEASNDFAPNADDDTALVVLCVSPS